MRRGVVPFQRPREQFAIDLSSLPPAVAEDAKVVAALIHAVAVYRQGAQASADDSPLPSVREFKAVGAAARRLKKAILKCGSLAGAFTAEAQAAIAGPYAPENAQPRILFGLDQLAAMADRAVDERWTRRLGPRRGPAPDLDRRLLEVNVAAALEGGGHSVTTGPRGNLALTLVAVYEAAKIRTLSGLSISAESLFRVLERLVDRDRFGRLIEDLVAESVDLPRVTVRRVSAKAVKTR